MKVIKDIKSLKIEIKQHKKAGKIIGLVPTMGAIHEGHLSLVKQIRKKADIVVATIFVNKKQFNNLTDFEKYPKNLQADIASFKNAKVDILFIPESREIYPDDFVTQIKLDKITNNLCGKTRPGHFDGVALIIVKLFNIVTPDLAIFGEKDFQQLQIIRRLVSNLNIETKIIAAKIIREKSGLALSSRNLRLDKNAAKKAPLIHQILLKMKQQILAKKNLKLVIAESINEITKSGFGTIDYLEICDEENLEPIKIFNKKIIGKIKARIFIAVYLGQVRLIDNISLY